MDIFVLTRDFASYDFDYFLRENGHRPMVCGELDSILSYANKFGDPMILCDFRIFGTESKNPYQTLKEKIGSRNIPFVFYNDPFPEHNGDDYLGHWKKVLQEYYGAIGPEIENILRDLWDSLLLSGCDDFEEDFVQSVPDFADASMEVESSSNSQSQIADDSSDGETDCSVVGSNIFSSPVDDENVLMKLRKRLKISFSKFELLRLLFLHRGTPVMKKDLCMELWNHVDQNDFNNLYAYVTFLRGKFKNLPECEIWIENVPGGYVLHADEQGLADL